MKDLDPELGPVERGNAVAAIEAEEGARGTRRAVAGFDFTFSVPKSAPGGFDHLDRVLTVHPGRPRRHVRDGVAGGVHAMRGADHQRH